MMTRKLTPLETAIWGHVYAIAFVDARAHIKKLPDAARAAVVMADDAVNALEELPRPEGGPH